MDITLQDPPSNPDILSEPVTLVATTLVPSEFASICTNLQRCLRLREKYLLRSGQQLGFDPRDYDGVFKGFENSNFTDVPEALFDTDNPTARLKWRIYPHPDKGDETDNPDGETQSDGEFDFTACEIPGPHKWSFTLDDNGVYQVYSEDPEDRRTPLFSVPSIREYFSDLNEVLAVIRDGPTKTFAYRRNQYLANKFDMHTLSNEQLELSESRRVPLRDFYNVRKVDTHIHHSSSMSQKHLLRFIKTKLKNYPNDVVIMQDGVELTLRQVFQSLNLTAEDLSIDTLDMYAHYDSFHRFDKFNLKYNPIGESRLREIFLKTDNHIQGRYLAELTKELMAELKQNKYQNSEWRISIYGRNRDEWDKLAKWVVDNKLFSYNVRWLIQVPRLYDVYKKNHSVQTFEDIVRNVFEPLFEVTQDPSTHPELHVFLQRVVGFDTVDDESKKEIRFHRKFPFPRLWDLKEDPPYTYWLYYLYANIASLNQWRRARGFCTFVLRPHCGEAGDPEHLASAFLAAHSISHGILLRKLPTLQYLFYLAQIGMAMSPLSNNALFLMYERNPLLPFFKVGLNVSLSTDDPLQFHFTKEPLLEEYSVATHIYKLSQTTLAELARNSVIQSGFEMEIKRHWIGDQWYLSGAAGNNINKTNVPNLRMEYRRQTLLEEQAMIRHHEGCVD